MNIIARYTNANIKSNRTRIPLIILCIAVAVLMFGASIIMPKLVRNFAEESAKSIYGSSDIYIAESIDNNNPVTSRYHIPTEIIDSSEYVAAIFALQGTIQFANKTQTTNLLGVEFADLSAFNPPIILEGKKTALQTGEMIVSQFYADENKLGVGDKCKFFYAGRFHTFKVAAIAENSGLFKWKSSNNIIVNQDTIKTILPNVPVFGMFNICVIKLKDNSPTNMQWAMNELEKAYPDWTVGASTDFERIDRVIQQNTGPLIVCTALVIVYCVFIILLTMELVFGERTRQFATMKALGASNGMQVKSILYESLFYGGIGGTLGTILGVITLQILKSLPDRYVFEGISWYYFVIMFVFGFIVSIVCSIIPAMKTLNMSLRQSMLNKKTSRKKLILIQSISAVVLVVSLIMAIVQPKGKHTLASPVIFLSMFISSLILVPYILRYILLLLSKTTKIRTFSTIYTQNSFLSSTLKVVSRILFFSLFLISFLISTVSTINSSANDHLLVDYYSVSVNNIYDGNGDFIKQELNSQSFVEKTYSVSVFSNNYFVDNDINTIIYDLKGMSIADIKSVYAKDIQDAQSSIELLNTERNYVVLNVKYKYVNNLQIGDEIEVHINKNNDFIKQTLIVAGFMESFEADSFNAIMNINTLNKITDLNSYNAVYIQSTDNNTDKVVEHLQKRFGNAYSINKFYENQKLKVEAYQMPKLIFTWYTVLIVFMSTVFVVVGLYLALRRSLNSHKIMNLLGMGSKQFVRTNFYQLAYVSVCSTFLTVLTVLITNKQVFNMFLMTKHYFKVVVDWGLVFLFIGITITLIIALSTIITKVHAKNFDAHERQSDE